MDKKKAFVIGMLGSTVMTLVMALARGMDLNVNISMMLGTMFGIQPGTGAWLLGFVVHLIMGGLFALIYSAGFEYRIHHAGIRTGMGYAVIHAFIAGFFLGFLPALHPLMPQSVAAPGFYMANLGWAGPVGFFLIHLIFGAVVGGMYHPVHQDVQVSH